MNIDNLNKKIYFRKYNKLIENEFKNCSKDLINLVNNSYVYKNVDVDYTFDLIESNFGLRVKLSYNLVNYKLSQLNTSKFLNMNNNNYVYFESDSFASLFNSSYSINLGLIKSIKYIGTILNMYDLFVFECVENLFSSKCDILYIGFSNK